MAQKEKSPPKIGRPKLPKGEAKSLLIRARVTPAEHRLIRLAAKTRGIEISKWVRKAILTASGA